MTHLVRKSREATAGTNVACGTVTVGTTATAFTNSTACYTVFLEADADNTANIFLGGDNITIADNRITLSAGQSISLPLRDMTKLYHISGTAAQKVHYLLITDN